MSQLPAVPNPEPDHETRLALIRLAREFARNILEKEEILIKLGISDEQYDEILKNPFYQKVLEAETLAFQGAANTKDRVAVEAAVTLEEFLPHLNTRMHDPEIPLAQAVEGAKLLAKLAGLGEKAEGNQSSGERFTIQINLGENKSLSYEGKPTIDLTPTAIEAPKDVV